MAPARNGRAPIVALPPGRKRFNAVPKTETFEVGVIRDGEPTTIDVLGYHKSACPVWCEVQSAQAWRDWREASYDAEGTYHESDEAEARLRRDMLLAVTRGLEEHDADVLARDGGGWLEILRALDWFGGATDDADEDDADPEAVGEGERAPTGPASSPASRRSTGRMTGSG